MKRWLYNIATDQKDDFMSAIVKSVLWVLSVVFRCLVGIRGFFYQTGLFKRHSLGKPVISVGNLTLGGVGKTPLVKYIAQHLNHQEIRVAILTRGYMDQGNSNSDEARMLQDELPKVPVLVGPNRVLNALTHLKHNRTDVFLLDDGFQHRRLLRDLDIVIVDATNPWGNGHLLPRGMLREPYSALRRADVIVLTKTDLGQFNRSSILKKIQSVNPNCLIIETVHKTVCFVSLDKGDEVALGQLSGVRACAVSSIGSPLSFKKTLRQLNVDIGLEYAYMDHYTYVRSDVMRIVQTCQDLNLSTIVTTQKDAVKLKPFVADLPESIRILALNIELEIVKGKDQFLERIHHIL